MNESDKNLYKALKYFADYSRAKVKSRKEEQPTEYTDNVPADVEITLSKFEYIALSSDTKYIITQKGLQQLRDLEQIKYRDTIIWISVLSLGISILSFAYAKGWLN